MSGGAGRTPPRTGPPEGIAAAAGPPGQVAYGGRLRRAWQPDNARGGTGVCSTEEGALPVRPTFVGGEERDGPVLLTVRYQEPGRPKPTKELGKTSPACKENPRLVPLLW
ncbi:hypothetical protein GCM10022206_53500 [Streptomyces chiangmaiensis]